MMEPSCLFGTMMPKTIIITTHRSLQNLIVGINSIPYLELNERNVVEYALLALAYERDAEAKLEYGRFKLEQDEFLCANTEDARRLSRMVHAFGLSMFQTFRALKLYRKGYLPYQFADIIANDLLLRQLEPGDPNYPDLNDPDSIYVGL